MRGPVEPDKMTFDLAVGEDWIDEYEIYKIAPGPIEIDSKIFVADWTVHHTWFKEQSYTSSRVTHHPTRQNREVTELSHIRGSKMKRTPFDK